METGELLRDLIKIVNKCCQVLWKSLGFNDVQDKNLGLQEVNLAEEVKGN